MSRLCEPMVSQPATGFPVLPSLLEFAQTHCPWNSAIPLSSRLSVHNSGAGENDVGGMEEGVELGNWSGLLINKMGEGADQ